MSQQIEDTYLIHKDITELRAGIKGLEDAITVIQKNCNHLSQQEYIDEGNNSCWYSCNVCGKITKDKSIYRVGYEIRK